LVDPEAIRRRLRQIDQRVGWLREIQAQGREAFRGSVALQAQAERHLQLAIQAAIDIALHLLAEESGEAPEDYGAAFERLGRRGTVDADLAGRLRLAAGLRNVLVHGYLDVDPDRVWAHLDGLDDLAAFARAVEDTLPR
jgi:uncharacterized protein YutE (UPF0331/DUF86 family)